MKGPYSMNLKKLSPRNRVEFPVTRSKTGVITNLSVRLTAVQALNSNYHVVKDVCEQLSATRNTRFPASTEVYKVIVTRSFWGLRKNVTVRPIQ